MILSYALGSINLARQLNRTYTKLPHRQRAVSDFIKHQGGISRIVVYFLVKGFVWRSFVHWCTVLPAVLQFQFWLCLNSGFGDRFYLSPENRNNPRFVVYSDLGELL